jgi:uncharacterized damage-inducible protein DinB
MRTLRQIAICLPFLSFAAAQRQLPTPVQGITNNFVGLNKRVLDMANDFPEAKYGYRPSDDVRSFGEVLIHIASGNVFAAKAVRDPQASWDELDAKKFKSKAEIVAVLQKSVDDATASLKSEPPEAFAKTLAPWLAVIEHEAEHFGQLVVYYRNNSMVPPESRPKK